MYREANVALGSGPVRDSLAPIARGFGWSDD